LFKRRISSASLALLVGVSALSPWAASAVPAPDPAWESYAGAEPAGSGPSAVGAEATRAGVEATGETAEATSEATQESTQAPKRKGNAFARALSAPFRALARLFKGGDRKDSAAKQQAPPTEQAQARPEPVLPVAEAAPAVPQMSAAPVGPVAQGQTAEAGARVVRPGEPSSSLTLPKTFIPVIEGIGRDPLSQGRALLQHGYIQEAVSELSVAATTVGPDSNLVEANNLLGLAYDRLGWHREAAEAYRRALTVAPSDPVILANLGYSLYLSNDFKGALSRLKQAARISPSLSVVHNNIGIVQARLGKFDEALRSFARASTQYDAHLKLAAIHEFEKRDRQAARHYESALRLQPNTSIVLERLVAIYERTGQRDKAESARRALGQPSNPQRTTTGGGG